MNKSSAEFPSPSTRRPRTLGLVALVVLIASESLAVSTVMPMVAETLRGLALYGFSFGAPLAASVLGMVAAGSWSDREHPATPLQVGLALFVAGLVASGLAPAMSWLLAGRIATGLGEGMVAVALYALVGRVYPSAEHARLYTMFSAAWVVPALCAPALSGLVAEHYGWRAVLLGLPLLTVPPALLLVPALRVAARGSKRVPRPWASPRLFWSTGAAAAALALHGAGQSGLPPTVAVALLAVSLLLMTACATRLLPPGTLRARRGLPAGIALQAASQAAFFSAEAFLPLVLVQHRGLAIATAGLTLTTGAVLWSAGAACRGHLGRFLSTQGVLTTGMTLVALGIASSLLLLLPDVPIAVAAIGWSVAGFGMGMVSPTLSVLTLALAPPDRHGETGAALRLSAALGTAAALAVNGALFAVLITRSPVPAYLGSLAAALLLAVLGVVISRRTAVVPTAQDSTGAVDPAGSRGLLASD